MALEVARHREVLGAVDVEVDERVEPGLSRERGAQLATVDRQRNGIDAVAVEHGGDLAQRAQAPRRAAAERAARIGEEGDFFHERRSLGHEFGC